MIISKLFSHLGITHGYSTRTQSRADFLSELHISSVTSGQQVHGIKIAKADSTDKGKILPGVDGLISKNVPIGVTFADCVPILAVDPKKGVIGTAHAGWKGTLHGIAKELIWAMQKSGASLPNTYISIGPHIGMCCYNVPSDRATIFRSTFGNDEKITAQIRGEWHLDIGYANYSLLKETGVPDDQIDIPILCTSCQISLFNSYRKDPKEKFSVQLGVIAL
jgi:YfiH family protein